MTNIVVIPDAHAHPKYDNDRFTRLGRYINRLRPQHVVSIGDFADLPSLCEHDKWSIVGEGRRYAKDLKATHDAQDKLFKAVDRPHEIQWHMTLGNHEDRISRACARDAMLDGYMSLADLEYEKRGWRVYPFLQPLELEGWVFCHYFPSGVMGRAIGGENAAKTTLRKMHTSCVFGHSHLLSLAEETKAMGDKITSINVGCFANRKQVETWNRNTAAMYWNGIVVIEGASKGQYKGLHFLREETLK